MYTVWYLKLDRRQNIDSILNYLSSLGSNLLDPNFPTWFSKTQFFVKYISRFNFLGLLFEQNFRAEFQHRIV